jgi:septal ring factor EnvC (AmiA/AmiB activator)
MAEDKKGFTFIIIPQNSTKTYTFRLARGLLYFLAASCLVLVLVFAYMLVEHKDLLISASRAERLEAENRILRDQTYKVMELEGELARLQGIRQHLFEMAGLSGGPVEGMEKGSPARSAVILSEEGLPGTAEVSTSGLAEIQQHDTAATGAAHVPSLWPVRGWVTAEFNESMPGREKGHQGVDIAASHGSPILSAASGMVAFSGWDKNLGLVVIVDHQNSLSTLYGHCSKVLVGVGEAVRQGQVIAHLGNTGLSSAPHLHFEIRENGFPLDPRSYLGP